MIIDLDNLLNSVLIFTKIQLFFRSQDANGSGISLYLSQLQTLNDFYNRKKDFCLLIKLYLFQNLILSSVILS